MRFSVLAFVLLLLISATLIAVAQHAAGGGATAAGSHGSSAGSVGSSASANIWNSAASQPHPTNSTGTHTPSSTNAEQGKNHGWSPFHPFRKEPAQPVQSAHIRSLCLKGSCQVCPPGQARRGGACVVIPNACQLTWNAYGCGTQAWFYHDCSLLANQLETERRWAPGENGAGRSLRYRVLQEQYERCVEFYGQGLFRIYALNDVPLFLQAP